MKTYDVIRVSNQNTSFDVVGGEVKIGKDNNGIYVVINGKKIYGLSRIEYICQVKVPNEEEQKKLKALKIIKEKAVNVYILLLSENLEDYNQYVTCGNLTQEEYDLLKEVLL